MRLPWASVFSISPLVQALLGLDKLSSAMVDYEAGISHRDPDAQASEARQRIDYNRRPETDMEACMPRHTLEIFGTEGWAWIRHWCWRRCDS